MSALPALTFGSLLRHHRLAAGLTQEELAEHAGVSPRAIAALESGQRRRPYRHTIQRLAAALQLAARDMEMLERAAGYARSAREQRTSDALVQTTPLIGRIKELGAIERYLDNSGPPVLVFAGEPGIGKSRLLDEAASRARARGFTVLEGGGHRQSGQAPYAPLLETLARSLTALPSPRLRAALTGCGWLVRLLPELVEIVSSPMPFGTVEPEQERRLVFDAVARYLTNLAGPAGTLLVLDDLQWASPDGLDMLTFLLRSGSNPPIRVVGAYRDTEVGQEHPLAATLGDLAQHNLAEQRTVELLADREVMELLDALLPEQGRSAEDGAVRQEIVRQAGGLPFFLVSCVQGLAATSANEPHRLDLPWNVAQSVRQRLAALPPRAQDSLCGAAVIGRTFDRRVLLAMDLATEPEVLAGLDAACRARLLVLESEREYRFAHDVIREVIEADLGAGQRMLLHRGVGQALEGLPDQSWRASELTWHFLQADDAERALHYSLLAGDEAEGVFAHGEAERHYLTAVTLAAELGDAPREGEVQEKLGKLLWIVGRFDEALAALERAMEMQQRAGNLDAEGKIAAILGWVLSSLGRPEEGISRLQTVAERLEASSPSPSLVALYTTLTHLFLRRGRQRDLAAVAERAAELAETVGDERMRAQAGLSRAFALPDDRPDEALALFEEVIVAAEKAGDIETLSRALIPAGSIYAARGEFERSRTYLEQNVDLHQRTSNWNWLADALRCRGDLLVVQGDWGGARENYERAAGMTLALTLPIAAWVRLSLARLCVLEGRWQDADACLEECAESVERSGNRASVPELQALLAVRDLWQRKADAALARLEPLVSQFDLGHDELMILAEAYMATGIPARAEEVVTSGAERAAAQKNRLAAADWRRLQGVLLAEQGRWEEAEGALSDAASLAATLSYPYAHARAVYEWGRTCSRRGAHREARTHLGQALAGFLRIGAHPFVERTEEALADVQ